MRRLLLAAVLVGVGGLSLWAQEAKDTQPAAATRKKLQLKIAVDFKDTRLEDALKELAQLIEEAGATKPSFQYDLGVSRNMTLTYSGKDKTVAEVFEGMFQKNGMGYIVVSKDKDRYDGWILIKQGKERGYPAGQEVAKKDDKTPKDKTAVKDKEKPALDKSPDKDKPVDPADKAEKAAAAKLSLAKDLLSTGKTEKVKERLQDLLKEYPNTKAAAEAKKLLEKLK